MCVCTITHRRFCFYRETIWPNEYETIDCAILQLIFNKYSIHKFTHLIVEPMKSLIYTNGFSLFKRRNTHAIKNETKKCKWSFHFRNFFFVLLFCLNFSSIEKFGIKTAFSRHIAFFFFSLLNFYLLNHDAIERENENKNT